MAKSTDLALGMGKSLENEDYDDEDYDEYDYDSDSEDDDDDNNNEDLKRFFSFTFHEKLNKIRSICEKFNIYIRSYIYIYDIYIYIIDKTKNCNNYRTFSNNLSTKNIN